VNTHGEGGVPIDAVTFDFWNTLMCETPDGLVAPRVSQWMGLLEEAGIPVEASRIEAAHAQAFVGYQAAWQANEQYRVAEATACMLEYLGLSVAEDLHVDLVDAFTIAGTKTRLELCPGVDTCLRQLSAAGIKLSIVCDIGLTPSPALRGHLEDRGLLHLFGSWAFSDEVGVYKPAPQIFDAALEPLDVPPERAAHVGDRRRTDVAGALDHGMVAVRYTGVYDDPDSGPEGDHLVSDLADLPRLLGVG
jgi:FMN phosphatase YigB (HAD superfamily)